MPCASLYARSAGDQLEAGVDGQHELDVVVDDLVAHLADQGVLGGVRRSLRIHGRGTSRDPIGVDRS